MTDEDQGGIGVADEQSPNSYISFYSRGRLMTLPPISISFLACIYTPNSMRQSSKEEYPALTGRTQLYHRSRSVMSWRLLCDINIAHEGYSGTWQFIDNMRRSVRPSRETNGFFYYPQPKCGPLSDRVSLETERPWLPAVSLRAIWGRIKPLCRAREEGLRSVSQL